MAEVYGWASMPGDVGSSGPETAWLPAVVPYTSGELGRDLARLQRHVLALGSKGLLRPTDVEQLGRLSARILTADTGPHPVQPMVSVPPDGRVCLRLAPLCFVVATRAECEIVVRLAGRLMGIDEDVVDCEAHRRALFIAARYPGLVGFGVREWVSGRPSPLEEAIDFSALAGALGRAHGSQVFLSAPEYDVYQRVTERLGADDVASRYQQPVAPDEELEGVALLLRLRDDEL